jgi:hypothetical protein
MDLRRKLQIYNRLCYWMAAQYRPSVGRPGHDDRLGRLWTQTHGPCQRAWVRYSVVVGVAGRLAQLARAHGSHP